MSERYVSIYTLSRIRILRLELWLLSKKLFFIFSANPCEKLKNGRTSVPHASACEVNFIECIDGQSTASMCPEGLVYDPDTSDCVLKTERAACQEAAELAHFPTGSDGFQPLDACKLLKLKDFFPFDLFSTLWVFFWSTGSGMGRLCQ